MIVVDVNSRGVEAVNGGEADWRFVALKGRLLDALNGVGGSFIEGDGEPEPRVDAHFAATLCAVAEEATSGLNTVLALGSPNLSNVDCDR